MAEHGLAEVSHALVHGAGGSGNMWRLAGLGIASAVVGGLVVPPLSTLVDLIVDMITRHFVVKAVYDSRDESYQWILHWLSQNPAFQRATNTSVTTLIHGKRVPDGMLMIGGDVVQSSRSEENDLLSAAELVTPVHFVPTGSHIIRAQSKWMLVHRSSIGTPSGGTSTSGSSRNQNETLAIYVLGTSRQSIERLTYEARRQYLEFEMKHTAMYMSDEYGNWCHMTTKRRRSLQSVILQENHSESILKDCQTFLRSEEWYARKGVPYRRGYLLTGPPGTGKTSFVTALAGELHLNVYMLNLSAEITDDVLSTLFSSAPRRCVLLLEDIDCLFTHKSGSVEVDDESNVNRELNRRMTFSGLLNALDGVTSQEGRLLFATTNHPEVLDNALIRPGRIDRQEKFGKASRDMVWRFFARFYEDWQPQYHNLHSDTVDAVGAKLRRSLDRDEVEQLRTHTDRSNWERCSNILSSEYPDCSLPMATVQGICLQNVSSPIHAAHKIVRQGKKEVSIRAS
eukprot:Clim_evm7s24 gene=Clim_evmTU7s24